MGGPDSRCQLCAKTLHDADIVYPLHCRATSCQFQYCLGCLPKLLGPTPKGFECAPGTQVCLLCPTCQEPFETEEVEAETVVNAVISLRQAASAPLDGSDNELSAGELAKRNEFLDNACIVELQEAYNVLRKYTKTLGKEDIPELEWDFLRPLFDKAIQKRLHAESGLLRDPTLFVSSYELLTLQEQKYITQLMSSGKPEALERAAFLIYAVRSSAKQQTKSLTDKEMSCLRKIVGEYPLPKHRPRCVEVPFFDPLNRPPLAFDKETHSECTRLIITKVDERLGDLRLGDMVTHVQGERVINYTEYIAAVKKESTSKSILITVNANYDTAIVLHERSVDMKENGVSWQLCQDCSREAY